MRRVIFSIARFGLSIPLNALYLLSCLVPKDRTLWLFSAWNGKKFSDNPKYIYKYLIENCTKVRAVWLTWDRKVFDNMHKQNLPVVYAKSLSGIVHQMRAGVVVFTHSVNWDFNPTLIGIQVKRIQTWHGMPIKKIGFDGKRESMARLKFTIKKWLVPYKNERYDLVISGSEIDKLRYASAFNVELKKICVTGYPRNDAIFKSIAEFRRDKEMQIIYMPTFRGQPNSEFQLLQKTGFDYTKADALLQEFGGRLYIKLHPVQLFSNADINAMDRCKNIKPLFNDSEDIYESIGEYDILITDYSGIYFDFLVTGKPIVMAPIDIDNYILNDRELYYSYNEICPDPPCVNWNQVLSRLCGLLKGEGIDNQRYTNLQKKFHKYSDGNSSVRAAKEIMRLVGISAVSRISK